MQNSKLKLVGSVLLIFLILSVGKSFASGQLRNLDSRLGQGSLSFAVSNRHAINYCIDIDSKYQREFTPDSLDAQLRMALSLWLSPIRNAVRSNISIASVSCSSKQLDLKLIIGPDTVAASSGVELLANTKYLDGKLHPFTQIRVSTTFKCDSHGLRTFNTMTLVDSVKTNSMDFQKTMEFMASRKMGTADFSVWTEKTGDPGGDNGVIPRDTAACSTLPTIIHEVGHGFGLCDTGKQHPGGDNCDPRYTTEKFDQAVMGNANFFYLTDDDVAGVVAVTKRFRSMSSTTAHVVTASHPTAASDSGSKSGDRK